MPKPITRCGWTLTDPLMIEYHDTEWGVPVHDDRKHFEFIILDAFQAGLSWAITLRKRAGMRKAFAGFDPRKVARFGAADIERLLNDSAIIRNRQKIEAAIVNARVFLAIQKEHGSFDAYIWRFVNGRTIVNRRKTVRNLPSTSRESDAMSKALKALGMKFVGSTICYAYMQAAGLVNDHTDDCFRK